MAGMLQHHVHEPRAPQAAAAGRIAAEIAASLGDETGPGRRSGFEGHAARVRNGIAVGKAARSSRGDVTLCWNSLQGAPVERPRLIANETRRADGCRNDGGIAERRPSFRLPSGISMVMPEMISRVLPSRVMTNMGLRMVRLAMIRAGRSR